MTGRGNHSRGERQGPQQLRLPPRRAAKYPWPIARFRFRKFVRLGVGMREVMRGFDPRRRHQLLFAGRGRPALRRRARDPPVEKRMGSVAAGDGVAGAVRTSVPSGARSKAERPSGGAARRLTKARCSLFKSRSADKQRLPPASTRRRGRRVAFRSAAAKAGPSSTITSKAHSPQRARKILRKKPRRRGGKSRRMGRFIMEEALRPQRPPKERLRFGRAEIGAAQADEILARRWNLPRQGKAGPDRAPRCASRISDGPPRPPRAYRRRQQNALAGRFRRGA